MGCSLLHRKLEYHDKKLPRPQPHDRRRASLTSIPAFPQIKVRIWGKGLMDCLEKHE